MFRKKTSPAEQPTIAYQRPLPRQRPFPQPAPAEMPAEIWLPVPPTRPVGGLLRLLAGALLLLTLLLALLFAGGALLLYESRWIFPGVWVLDVPVGGLTQTEAAVTLADSWQNRRITLVSSGRSWAVAPAELGMILDAGATAARAHQQGRTWDSLRQGWQQRRFTVVPAWQLDTAVAAARLTALAPEITIAPVEAGLVWQNGRFLPTPAASGQTLDVDATLALLTQQAAQGVIGGRFDLISKPLLPTFADAAPLAEQANARLSHPIAVRAYDPISDQVWTWQLTPELWGQWLTLDTAAAQRGELQWRFDAAQAGAYLNTQVAALGGGRYVNQKEAGTAVAAAVGQPETAVGLRIYHQPRQHTVRPGETLASIGRDYGIPYPWIQQANPGLQRLFAGQTITIPSPDELIPLPVVENKRIIVSITQQRMWVYENGTLKWEWPVSTGIVESPTAPGIFQIQSHEENAYAGNWDLWMPYFMGIYRPVPTVEFMNGFHGFPTRGGSQLLWTGNLGQPVTYGCILISTTNAQMLYNWAEKGIIVEVQP